MQSAVGGRSLSRCSSRARVRAFSLIELIVVIGIIALLIALLLPTLHRAREAAQVSACASNVRQIVILLRMYAQGNDGRLPYQALGIEDWSGPLAKMARSRNGFACPADDTVRRPDTEKFIRSYGVNNGPFLPSGGGGAGGGAPTGLYSPWPVDRYALAARISKVPSHVFLVGDNGGQYAGSAAFVGADEAEALDGTTWGVHRIKTRRGDNYGFADGHVEYRVKQEMDRWWLEAPSAALGGLDDPWRWKN